MLILDSIISSAINNLSVFSESLQYIENKSSQLYPQVSSKAHRCSHIHLNPKKKLCLRTQTHPRFNNTVGPNAAVSAEIIALCSHLVWVGWGVFSLMDAGGN